MDDDRGAGTPGTGRRGVLKGLLAVGSAAPMAGLLSQTGAQAAPVQPGQARANRARASQERASGTSQQLAGQAGMDLLLCAARDPGEGQTVTSPWPAPWIAGS
jgi:hypothetical protein